MTRPKAALIDMDGVLYDSMPQHAAAWQRMFREVGIDAPISQYYALEGMTGEATCVYIFDKYLHRTATPDEVKHLYHLKTEYFRQGGPRIPMPGAADVLQVLRENGVERVLVTGSGQKSLLEAIRHDFPNGFTPGMRVTAFDVTHGKPHPEPYLRGLEKAGVAAHEAIVIENAPLGVQSAVGAGIRTIGVNTGPLPPSDLYDAGASLVLPSMADLATYLKYVL